MTEQKDNGKLETFAIVEVMGHGKFAGFVREVAIGSAAMIRVDVPEIPEYTEEYESWEYEPLGESKRVKKTRTIPATPKFTKFLGVSSIFAITPCSEETAMQAVKQFRSPPVSVLHVPTAPRMLPCEDYDYEETGL